MRRISQGHAGRVGAPRLHIGPRFVAAILFGGLLPGCPLSDAYFVDPNLTQGSGGAGADSGTGGIAGVAAKGGKDGGTTAGTGGKSGRSGKGDAGAPAAGAPAMAGMPGTAGMPAMCEPSERCDGLDNDCNDEIDEGSVCPESCSAQQYDGHAYVLCVSTADADLVDADDASTRCDEIARDNGLTLGLAWIESRDENDFLHDWIVATAPDDGVVWIGANDQAKEGVWVWGRRADAVQFYEVTDKGQGPVMDRFNDFGMGQPGGMRGLDEDCGAFDAHADWHWGDRECSEPMVGFVCEEHPP